jgi:phage-related protein
MKDVVWLGDSDKAVAGFSLTGRQRVNYQIQRLQGGFDPTDWRPLKEVGPGVREIRVRADTWYRVLYLATQKDAIYILHAFTKKGRKTPKRDIELAKRRLKQLRQHLRG